MFGFGNNPDRETCSVLRRQSHNMAVYFSYIFIKNCIPPKDGEDAISLNNEKDKQDLVESINLIINQNDLNTVECGNLTGKINELCLHADEVTTSRIYENALSLITMMNGVDCIAKIYYLDYPKSKKLFSLLNDLAKVCCPALIKVFDGTLQEKHREIWPHLSCIFEAYRANG